MCGGKILFNLGCQCRDTFHKDRGRWPVNLIRTDLNKRAVNLIENAVIVNLLYHLLLTEEIN